MSILGAGALVAIGARVFASSELLTRPTEPYPAAAPVYDSRPYSELRAAPLIVDDRLRVYAEKWRVWSDGPVGSRYEGTPYWALRRWPAQVLGVVAAGQTVITQWSDGQLIAIDASTGGIAWRATDPISTGSFDGRRTGASTVYSPHALVTVPVAGTPGVAVLTAPGLLLAYSIATGDVLWRRDLPSGCTPATWSGQVLVAVPDCAGTGLILLDALSGRPVATWRPPAGSPAAQPSYCALGRSECPTLVSAGRTWQLHADGSMTDLGTLPRGALLSGDRVIYQTRAGVSARPVTSTHPLWTWTGQGRILAANATQVYLLTDDGTVLGLDAATGRLAMVGCSVAVPTEHWYIGHVYAPPVAADHGAAYLALERLNTTHSTDGDEQYFYTSRPFALVELYPPDDMDQVAGKFAACSPL